MALTNMVPSLAVSQSLQTQSTCTTSTSAAGASRLSKGSPQPHASAVHAAAAASAAARGGTRRGQFAPVLLLDHLARERGTADCFTRVVWGGGPDLLLAAATKQHVYFFSLNPFFQVRCSPRWLTDGP